MLPEPLGSSRTHSPSLSQKMLVYALPYISRILAYLSQNPLVSFSPLNRIPKSFKLSLNLQIVRKTNPPLKTKLPPKPMFVTSCVKITILLFVLILTLPSLVNTLVTTYFWSFEYVYVLTLLRDLTSIIRFRSEMIQDHRISRSVDAVQSANKHDKGVRICLQVRLSDYNNYVATLLLDTECIWSSSLLMGSMLFALLLRWSFAWLIVQLVFSWLAQLNSGEIHTYKCL